MKIKIEDAKAYQLRKYAEEVLGLQLRAGESAMSIKAKIAAVIEGDEIDVSEDDPALPKLQKAAPELAEKPAKVTIIISRTNEPGGNQPVPVAVNGRAMLIPRGEPVEIPEHFFEALKNAERAVYDQYPDGGINPTPRIIPEYPFQRIA